MAQGAIAQIEYDIEAPDSIPYSNFTPIDTGLVNLDTTRSIKVVADTLKSESSESSIETTIDYSANDSINIDDNTKIVKLYGDAKITYGDIEITAAEVEIDYKTNIMKARSYTDSTGEVIGKPVFKDGQQIYYSDEMAYNFKTKKAVSKGVVTTQGDANMRGKQVYKNQYDEMFIKGAIYTTCNRPEPHYHIQTDKIKLIPGNKVVTGPGHFAVKNIPIPFGFPFGIFPMPNKKASGVVVPTYGEEKRRGFYLRNGGYYFAMSEYADLEVLGNIYSTGSWGVSLSSAYTKKYAFSGRLGIRYNNQTALSATDSTVTKDFWLNWSHSPKSKGNSRFSASANFGTSSYNQNNPTINLTNTLKQDYNSSISYSTTLRGTPFSLSVRGRFQQNVQTKAVNLLLPETSISMNRIYPFKFLNSGKNSPLEKLSVSWNLASTNKINNKGVTAPSDFKIVGIEDRSSDVIPFKPSNFGLLFDRAQNGVQHRIPVSTTIKAFKYFTFNPSFNYSETWYFKKLRYNDYDPVLGGVKIDTLSGFNRLYQYSGGASLNTTVYGTAYFKKGKINAIRHVMRPSVSMSFSPDFSADRFNYYKDVTVDSTGRTKRLGLYDGFVYGIPTSGQSATLGLNLTNNLEMKVKSKKDSVNDFKKVSIFDAFNLSTGYNFLADSFKLSRINFNARTKLFNNKLNVNFASTIDPYIYQLDSTYIDSRGETRYVQHQRNIYAWDAGKGIGQISNARLGLSIRLKPKGTKDTGDQLDEMGGDAELTNEERSVRDFVRDNPQLYVDFDIPWSLNLNYNISYSKRGFEDTRITQVMSLNGDVNLTDQWKITFSSGYDFQRKEITQTNFSVNRDLHCWVMSFQWSPFGRYEYYNLTINVKSALLKDLKVQKQQSWFDN